MVCGMTETGSFGDISKQSAMNYRRLYRARPRHPFFRRRGKESIDQMHPLLCKRKAFWDYTSGYQGALEHKIIDFGLSFLTVHM